MAEKEYIERGALLRKAKKDAPSFYKIVMILTHSIPAADVVEVVRCKDCEHCQEYRNWNFDRYLGCNFNGEIYRVEPTHFCSYGGRKEQK